MGASLILGLFLSQSGKKLNDGTENIDRENTASVEVVPDLPAKHGVNDRMEHGSGDILLFMLIEVVAHVIGTFDLREPDYAHGTVAELSRSREHDVIRGLAERI